MMQYLTILFGRVASYTAWASLAQWAHGALDMETEFEGAFLSLCFIGSQCITLGLLVLFVRLDWGRLLHKRQLRLPPARWQRRRCDDNKEENPPSARRAP